MRVVTAECDGCDWVAVGESAYHAAIDHRFETGHSVHVEDVEVPETEQE